jgi:hypothetical protein
LKTYLDIRTSDPLINISTRDISNQKHAKIKEDGILNIILIDIGDTIVVKSALNNFSNALTSI